MQTMKFLSDQKKNELAGKAYAGALNREEQLSLIKHIAAFESKLDDYDLEDFFGTEGWRHNFGVSHKDD